MGVARRAVVHAVKVLDDQGYGAHSGIIQAFDWLVRNARRPAVVSCSFGATGQSTVTRDAVDRMVRNDITVVVAAGNDRADACGYSPAFVPSAISVGSIALGDRRSGFSNFGSCVDIWAPGSNIRSASNSGDTATRTMSGTSMACPHVSGGVAVLLGSGTSRQM